MKKIRWIAAIVFMAASVLIAAYFLLIVFPQQAARFPERIPTSQLLPYLSGPPNDRVYTPGAKIPIQVDTIAESPIASYELWVDGILVETLPAGERPGRNLAERAPVTATGESPLNAVDGNRETVWESGGNDTQWIEIDLGYPRSIAELRLLPSNDQVLDFGLRVLGRPSLRGEPVLLAENRAQIFGSDDVVFTPEEPWPLVRFLRLESRGSPVFFSLEEIEVFAPADPPGTATLMWQPEDPGTYTIQIRATDSEGVTALSNVSRITVVEDTGGVAMDLVTAKEGDTLESIAAENSIPRLDWLMAYNNFSPSESLPAGAEILIPQSNPFTEGEVTEERVPLPQPPALPENPILIWISLVLGSGSAALPKAPTLAANPEGCSVQLQIGTADEGMLGTVVYRLDPTSPAFQPIAYLDAATNTFTDADVAGSVQYYAASFNAAGESPGGIVPVKINEPGCGALVAAGADPQIENGILETAQSAAAVYLYISHDGSSWLRVPQAEGTFISGQNGTYDLQSYLPDGIGAFQFEAWGWSGGKLVFLGSGTTAGAATYGGGFITLPIDLTNLAINDYAGDIKLGVVTEKRLAWNASPAQFDLEFNWSTQAPAQEILWQVSAAPFQSASDLNPPGLLAEGKESASMVYFNIDFATIVSPPPVTGSTSNQPPSSSTGPFSGTDPFANAPMDLNVGEAVIPQEFVSIPIDTYYVRILPMANNKVVGFPSNTVLVRYGPPEEGEPITLAAPMEKLFSVRIIDFDPGGYPDPNRWGCVVIVDNSNYYFAPVQNPYPIGKVVCPPKLDTGGGFNLIDVIEAVGSAWDWAAGKINALKASVVGFVADKLCSNTVGDTGGTCEGLVAAGVDIALAAYGIPPTLPSAEQLTEQGKDYLVELAAQELEAKGIPCTSECRDLIRSGLEAGIDAVASQSLEPGCTSEKEAAEHGKKPLCLEDEGYVVRPAPGAAYYPPVAVLEVTRLPGGTAPDWFKVCYASLEMAVMSTTNAGDGTIRELREVLFIGGAKLFDMAPGTVLEIPVSLDPTNRDLDYNWYIANNEEYGVNPITPYGNSLEWWLVYNGRDATSEISIRETTNRNDPGFCLQAENTWTEVLP